MTDFYLGRQPIFDRALAVIGYELLYRPHDAARAGDFDGDQATSQVLLNSFVEIGLPKLVGERSAFINLTRNFLVNHDLLPPASDRIVLEVLETIEVDDELVAAIRSLRDKQYTIALDDFAYNDALRPLVELADIVKIDLRALDEATLREHVAILRDYPVKLLAEKVETPQELDRCRELGFDYFQGYFLCCPRNIKGKRLPANRVNTLRLVAKLQHPRSNIDELEEIIAQDVTLSYKLLRYLNSAAFFGRKEITSIRHAIVYLGNRAIKNWGTLIALADIDDKPVELITTSLVRGRMCELLAKATGKADTASAFTVGMFSVLDAMMDAPLPELVAELPLSESISEALLHHQGEFGNLLQSAVAYDRGDWEHIVCPELQETDIAGIYVQAVEWAGDMMATLEQ
jgi:EAL and modified HD-GYP domain-containing signal transduction protein